MQKNEVRRDVEKTFYLNASLCDLSFAGKTKGLNKDIAFLQLAEFFLEIFHP